MNLILLSIFLCVSPSLSELRKEFLPFRKRQNIFSKLRKRHIDGEYLEQCAIINFTNGLNFGKVNVLAFLDATWQYSHRQAVMLKDLMGRFERYGLVDINFVVINSMSTTKTQQVEIDVERKTWMTINSSEAENNVSPVELNVETLKEILGDEIVFIQDDLDLDIWRKLHVSRDQIVVVDGCGQLTYQVIVPWSILHFPYVKAAILSTFNDEPCGACKASDYQEIAANEPINDQVPNEDESTTLETMTTIAIEMEITQVTSEGILAAKAKDEIQLRAETVKAAKQVETTTEMVKITEQVKTTTEEMETAVEATEKVETMTEMIKIAEQVKTTTEEMEPSAEATEKTETKKEKIKVTAASTDATEIVKEEEGEVEATEQVETSTERIKIVREKVETAAERTKATEDDAAKKPTSTKEELETATDKFQVTTKEIETTIEATTETTKEAETMTETIKEVETTTETTKSNLSIVTEGGTIKVAQEERGDYETKAEEEVETATETLNGTENEQVNITTEAIKSEEEEEEGEGENTGTTEKEIKITEEEQGQKAETTTEATKTKEEEEEVETTIEMINEEKATTTVPEVTETIEDIEAQVNNGATSVSQENDVIETTTNVDATNTKEEVKNDKVTEEYKLSDFKTENFHHIPTVQQSSEVERNDDRITTIEIAKNQTKLPNVRSISNSKNHDIVSWQKIEMDKKNSDSKKWTFPIRIIMKAPHLDINENSLVKHDYLILKTDNENYHQHFDSGIKIELPRGNFNFSHNINNSNSENSDLKKIIDILNIENHQLLSNQNFPPNENETNFKNKLQTNELKFSINHHNVNQETEKIDHTIFGKDESPGIFDTMARDDFDIFHTEKPDYDLIYEMEEMDKNLENYEDEKNLEYSVSEKEERAKIKLIDHYSKLLSWIHYVLN
ncbi:J domain-containing protein DDB_G0295729-like isoform X3 [Leptopilina heterotoma]|uniref:J domain-containing protein DDB_G0295729-like isoform X3 n=1 Tax=Leptopilina heterotoma TaxID=63436 RepID=UPI001CA81A3C|nr:J domain-containing protein DDB_G0295729-like isoform X3 [Leptopilina heterotoma]